MSILENFKTVRERVENAAKKTGRRGDSVTIIAVSKTFPAETVQEAINGGITLFGENKIQEAKKKIPLLQGEAFFHMIGHLQSNKAKDAVRLFDLIHSIDKFSTARKIDSEAAAIDKKQKILIQVNTSGEDAKSGTSPELLADLLGEVLTLTNVTVEGLMTMAPFTGDERLIRNCFALTRELLVDMNRQFSIAMKELSMGMSGDFETAVEEGATMVRVGSMIFGERTYT